MATRFLDLCAGLGGFHLAMQELGGECVFACEIDERLRDLYKKNYGISPAGDIRRVRLKDIPKHELLCAGFPCQPFSKAGSQMGWADTARGTVFHDILKILEVHKPKLVLLENVAHFVKHDEGNTYQKVKRKLEKLGYEIQSRQLSPHQFGVPQIRERMYMVGRYGGLDGFVWPDQETEVSDLSIRAVLDKNPPDAIQLSRQVLKCLEAWQEFLDTFPKKGKLPSFPVWSMEFGATYPYDRDSLSRVPISRLHKSRGSCGARLRGLSRAEIKDCVPSYARASRGAFPPWKRLFIKQNRELYQANKAWIDRWLPKIRVFPPSLQKLEWNCQGEERNIWKYVTQFRASGVRIKRPATAPSLVAMTTTQVPIIAWEKRYMTIKECARLQSMNKLKYLPNGTAGMKALGNAVNVTVARLVLENLLQLQPKTCRKRNPQIAA